MIVPSGRTGLGDVYSPWLLRDVLKAKISFVSSDLTFSRLFSKMRDGSDVSSPRLNR